jgi:hypothetical protein
LGKRPQRFICEVTEIKWLDGRKKILFKPSNGSTQMYNFDKNEKWKWGPSEKDQWRPGGWFSTSIVIGKIELFGNID